MICLCLNVSISYCMSNCNTTGDANTVHANILVNEITNDIMRIENKKPSTIPKSTNSLPMIFTYKKGKEPL